MIFNPWLLLCILTTVLAGNSTVFVTVSPSHTVTVTKTIARFIQTTTVTTTAYATTISPATPAATTFKTTLHGPTTVTISEFQTKTVYDESPDKQSIKFYFSDEPTNTTESVDGLITSSDMNTIFSNSTDNFSSGSLTKYVFGHYPTNYTDSNVTTCEDSLCARPYSNDTSSTKLPKSSTELSDGASIRLSTSSIITLTIIMASLIITMSL